MQLKKQAKESVDFWHWREFRILHQMPRRSLPAEGRAASTQLACKQFEPEQFRALVDSHYTPTTSLPSMGPVISPREEQRERATEGNRVQRLSDADRAHWGDCSVKAYFVLCIDYMHSMKYDGKSTSKREAGTARAHFLLTVYSSNSSNTLWKWQDFWPTLPYSWVASTQLACKQFEPEQFRALVDSNPGNFFGNFSSPQSPASVCSRMRVPVSRPSILVFITFPCTLCSKGDAAILLVVTTDWQQFFSSPKKKNCSHRRHLIFANCLIRVSPCCKHQQSLSLIIIILLSCTA